MTEDCNQHSRLTLQKTVLLADNSKNVKVKIWDIVKGNEPRNQNLSSSVIRLFFFGEKHFTFQIFFPTTLYLSSATKNVFFSASTKSSVLCF